MAADSSNYIDLTLPAKLSPEQRNRMIAAHNRLLSILNNPSSAKEAKTSARKAMQELRNQIAMLGGKVVTSMPSYQHDPTTGEITGVIKGAQPAQPAKPRSIQTGEAHQVRVPVTAPDAFERGKQKVNAALDAAATAAGKIFTGKQTIAETITPAAAPAKGFGGFAGGSMAGGGGAGDTQVGRQPSATIAPAPTVAPTAATPVAASGVSVPPESADLTSSSVIGAIATSSVTPAASQPAAPAETPEMMALRRLINEPQAPPPSAGLTNAQKAAFGFLVGLKPEAAGGVAQIISGQRADAVQKYVLGQQQREAHINELLNLVKLQEAQAEKTATREQKEADRASRLDATATAINAFHGNASPQILHAINYLNIDPASGNVRQPSPLNDADPAVRARAGEILSKVQGLQGIGSEIDTGFKRNPDAIGPEQLSVYSHALDGLVESLDKAISETIKRDADTKLPEAVSSQVAALHNSSSALKQAIQMVQSGVGGPIASRFLGSTVGATIADVFGQSGAVDQVAVLDALAETASVERARGTTGRLANFETEIAPAIFLRSTLPPTVFIGRAKALIAYTEAKAAYLTGRPGAQTEAERNFAEAAGLVVVGHTDKGYPVWQSPQGMLFDETPENP